MAETQDASVGYFGEFWLYDGTILKELVQVTEFDVPERGAREQVEKTHLKSPDWTREYTIALQAGYPGSSLIGAIRLAPDVIDPVLVSFTVSGPSVVDGVTSFTLSLTKVQTAALPADSDGNGTTEFAYDLLFTPSGGTQSRLFGGVAQVLGKVTNAS